MPEMKTLSVMIYEALNAKGAGLGNASIGIIEDAIAEYEAAHQSVERTAEHAEDCAINVGMLGECDCGAAIIEHEAAQYALAVGGILVCPSCELELDKGNICPKCFGQYRPPRN